MASKYFYYISEFKARYEERYGEVFYPQPHHFKQVKPLVDGIDDFEGVTLDDWCARLKVYFNSGEDWVRGCRHNLSVFIKHFHRFIPEKQVKHVPDAEQMIHCAECGKVHAAGYRCWLKQDAPGVAKRTEA